MNNSQITPFTSTLSPDDGLISSVYAIFFAEIVTKTVIQLVDPVGHFQRHILAPRATDQDSMNRLMLGIVVELAERVTNMTMLLFLALWYCSIYPGALFMCCLALTINFYADKFSLMRSWKRLPLMGTSVCKFSRRYFFSTAVIAMAVVSSYFWSGFPYDNLCESSSRVPPEIHGTHELGEGVSIVIGRSDLSYRYCAQTLASLRAVHFPSLSRFQTKGDEWMTPEQEEIVDVFGWTSVGVTGLVFFFFANNVRRRIAGLFSEEYKSVGIPGKMGFSELENPNAFVPQVKNQVYSYPLLVCKGFSPHLVTWEDPDKPHSYYDLTEDAVDLAGEHIRDKKLFSILSHCPPGDLEISNPYLIKQTDGDDKDVEKFKDEDDGGGGRGPLIKYGVTDDQLQELHDFDISDSDDDGGHLILT